MLKKWKKNEKSHFAGSASLKNEKSHFAGSASFTAERYMFKLYLIHISWLQRNSVMTKSIGQKEGKQQCGEMPMKFKLSEHDIREVYNEIREVYHLKYLGVTFDKNLTGSNILQTSTLKFLEAYGPWPISNHMWINKH